MANSKPIGKNGDKHSDRKGVCSVSAFHTLNAANAGGAVSKQENHATPIADLFPEATVMFADIVQFTAWSSQRQPSQVLFLLEAIYEAFDRIARRHKGKYFFQNPEPDSGTGQRSKEPSLLTMCRNWPLSLQGRNDR